MTKRPASTILKQNEVNTVQSNSSDPSWTTTLFNDDYHSIYDVAAQVVKAIGCSSMTAHQLATIAHHTGSSIIIRASKERCEAVAAVLEEIKLSVAVNN